MAERTSRLSPSYSMVNVIPNKARSIGRGMPGMAPSKANGEHYSDTLSGQLNTASRY